MSAQTFREATPQERAVYRRWIRGAIVFYGVASLLIGTLAWMNHAGVGQTQLTSLSSAPAANSRRAN